MSKSKINIGIVLYNIENDGCLNGLYTNESPTVRGEIFNEIARKKTGEIKDSLAGIYDCFFFDNVNERVNCELEILSNKSDKILTFIWRNSKGIVMFKGTGYKMNDKQIVVHYFDDF